MRCSRNSAEARYRICRNLRVLLLACIAIFVAITIKEMVTGSPLSSSTPTFVAIATALMCFNTMNMRKAKEEMDENE